MLFLELYVEGIAADAQTPGGLLLVPTAFFKDLLQQFFLLFKYRKGNDIPGILVEPPAWLLWLLPRLSLDWMKTRPNSP
jgi:hypothetical protein